MDQVKIGKFIAQLRKEKGFTQQELADMLSLSPKTISKWENGRGMPELSSIKPLCDCLGITTNELLSGECLEEEQYLQKLEENIFSTMQYTTFREKMQRKKAVGIGAFIGLVLISLLLVTIFKVYSTENEDENNVFLREEAKIEQLIQYQSDYVGDNSNDMALVQNLPLAEYGFVLEIDSENLGLTIDYHTTDWYMESELYLEKSLIYNSVSIFLLIDNVQSITYNFSGSSYSVTREAVENQYPQYEVLENEGKLNQSAFEKYVEKKIDSGRFVTNVFEKMFGENAVTR